jgi:hypothetical protein
LASLTQRCADLILDGSGVEHGHVIHGNALLYDPLTSLLQLLLAIGVSQVQQTYSQEHRLLTLPSIEGTVARDFVDSCVLINLYGPKNDLDFCFLSSNRVTLSGANNFVRSTSYLVNSNPAYF